MEIAGGGMVKCYPGFEPGFDEDLASEAIRRGFLSAGNGEFLLPDERVSPERKEALAVIAKGLRDALLDQCTIEESLATDLARAIERCGDREELRHLSACLRDALIRFQPDASQVAMTETEARILSLIPG